MVIKAAQGDSAIQIAYSLHKSELNVNSSVILATSYGQFGSSRVTLINSTGLSNITKVETYSGIASYDVQLEGITGAATLSHPIKVRNGAFYILSLIQDPTNNQVSLVIFHLHYTIKQYNQRIFSQSFVN